MHATESPPRQTRAHAIAVLRAEPDPLAIIRAVAALLADERVDCCQWKGAGAPARWCSGARDIDLLVAQAHADRFRSCASRLGLKLVLPADGAVPGIESYLGLDRATGRLVHFHVYYRLLVGTPRTALFALPLERAMLESAGSSGHFPTPRPDLELIAVVLHRLLGERLVDALRRRPGRAVPADVARLRELVPPAALAQALHRHLPELPVPLFQRCLSALSMPRSVGPRTILQLRVRRALRACAVPATGSGWRQAMARRLPRTLRAWAAAAEGKRLPAGGVIVALVGGDGAGKSTCAAALRSWLASELTTRHFHLGRPPRSLFCLAVGALARLAGVRHRVPATTGADDVLPSGMSGILVLLRGVAVARDRYRLYRRARGWALRGAVVFCERYPLPQNRLLVGPRRARAPRGVAQSSVQAELITNRHLLRRLADWLLDLEASYYEQIAAPDVVAVLRLAPELAVQRKPDEPAEYVRRRAAIIWNTDWSGTGAVTIDAAQPLALVLARLKETVWQCL